MIGTDSGRYDNCETGEDANNDPDCARVAGGELAARLLGARRCPARPASTLAAGHPARLHRRRNTGCGQATSQVGPFYCPPDQGIYLDTTFFDEVLEQQLGGPYGGFVEYYVIAHEYGHHIQNLLGTMGRVRPSRGPERRRTTRAAGRLLRRHVDQAATSTEDEADRC